MADKEKKTVYDWVTDLALPAVVGVGGLLYTCHKDDVDLKRDDNNRSAQIQRDENNRQAQIIREEWKQDADYVKMLASTSAMDQQFASSIIEQLRSEKRFPEDLEKTVNKLAGGRPSDPITQQAAATSPAQNAGGAPAPGPIAVYIQYALSDQLCDVKKIGLQLKKSGYEVPNPEYRAVSPQRTDVRYFSSNSEKTAEKISGALHQFGYKSHSVNFQATSPVQLRQIEVWLGRNDNPHLSTTENGLGRVTEDGKYLTNLDCKPS